ncbi:hypothetical protein [Klebsiella variicola]|uniref:hypothetical protein n=1 Tax=Klebsiella variicola TaxID=244366 RepID=UPI001CDAB67D|nr:hypothetical protein [Klebsiella variicola]
MNSKLTRERLQEIAEDGFLKHGESKELARMALAAMDGEPVAWTWHYREQWHVTNDERRAEFVAKDGDVAVLPLYRHAQPAPVVQMFPEEPPEHLLPKGNSRDTTYRRGAIILGWKLCRAAMLERQLVDHVDEESLITIKAAPALGSLPKTGEVQNTNDPAIPDGYVMVPKEPTEAMMLHNSGCQHHAWDDPDCAMRQTRRLIWSHMLAAAPQEVK